MGTLEYQSSPYNIPRKPRRPALIWAALWMNLSGVLTISLNWSIVLLGLDLGFIVGGFIFLVLGAIALVVALANCSVNLGMLLDPAARRDGLCAINSTLCGFQLIYWITVFLMLLSR